MPQDLSGRRADKPADEVQALLEALAEADAPDIATLSVAQARRVHTDLFTPDTDPTPVADVTERKIRAYARDIRVRIYDPEPDESLPAVVYFHGGGWVLGNLDTHDSVARSLAADANVVVVSVDYRKAPEHEFPAAVEDAAEATMWVADNASEIGAGDGLAVAGESAGGNLAAVTAQRATTTAVAPDIDHQLLFYPVTNHAYDTPSYETNREGYFLTRRLMVWFWNHYLRGDEDGYNVLASPLQGSLEGLPPATVFTCGFDPLRDEGVQYVDALREADVPVEHTNYADMIHDLANMAPLDGAPGVTNGREQILEDATTALREAL